MKTAVISVLASLPFFYLLSAGPAFWIVNTLERKDGNFIWRASFHRFYAPIDWVAEYSPEFSSFRFWYVGLWEPRSREMAIRHDVE